MSTPTESTETPETTEVPTPEPETTEPAPTEEPKPEVKAEDELPDWARKELTKVRGEAANYRTKLREAEKSLADAKTPEEFESARNELTAKIAELEAQVLRSEVARKHELPDELAERLRGETKEELEADAKALLKFVTPSAPERLSGGLTPDESGDGDFDPVATARAARRRY